MTDIHITALNYKYIQIPYFWNIRIFTQDKIYHKFFKTKAFSIELLGYEEQPWLPCTYLHIIFRSEET